MSANQQSHPISSLNEPQKRNLRNACKHIDGLLKDVEEALDPNRNSVFPKYIEDVTPVQQKVIGDQITYLRAQLLRVLASQAIEVEKPRLRTSHAIHTSLTFVEIAIEELSPGRMQGYGPVSEAGAADLNDIMQSLQSIALQLHCFVLLIALANVGLSVFAGFTAVWQGVVAGRAL